MIKTAIFDLDGTLCYTIEDLRTAMNAMLADFGYPLRTPEDILAAINFGAREFVRRSLPENVRSDDALVGRCFERYSAHYDRHFLDSTYPYDGVAELLPVLKSNGISLAVLTNKGDRHAKALIGKLFGDGIFDIVQGNTERFPTKPDPSSALWIAEQFGSTAREVLYIGDSDVDMKTARNAGFFACGVTWGYRAAPLLIKSGAAALADRPADITMLL